MVLDASGHSAALTTWGLPDRLVVVAWDKTAVPAGGVLPAPAVGVLTRSCESLLDNRLLHYQTADTQKLTHEYNG